MVRCSTLARVVALCLLLLTAGGLFACEIVAGVTCELAGTPPGSESSTDDHCLCCCYHVALAPPPELDPPSGFVLDAPVYKVAGPTRSVASPELPPRL